MQIYIYILGITRFIYFFFFHFSFDFSFTSRRITRCKQRSFSINMSFLPYKSNANDLRSDHILYPIESATNATQSRTYQKAADKQILYIGMTTAGRDAVAASVAMRWTTLAHDLGGQGEKPLKDLQMGEINS